MAIITGFPCLLKHDPPTETDGPPGAYALARACIALGHKVYLLTDEVLPIDEPPVPFASLLS